MVKVLLENDAQVDLQGNHGQSSLMAASHSGHVDVGSWSVARIICSGRFAR